MVSPKTQSNFLPAGKLVFKAPLTYYIVETDSRGLANFKKENEGKKYICFEVKED